jgi:hypothetical protein
MKVEVYVRGSWHLVSMMLLYFDKPTPNATASRSPYFFGSFRRVLSSIDMKWFSVMLMATPVTRPTTSASFGWRNVRVCWPEWDAESGSARHS